MTGAPHSPTPSAATRSKSWWILAAGPIAGSTEAAKAAGVALARLKNVDAKITLDAIVMATAALLDAVVVTGDPDDFERLAAHFSGVAVISA
jgi:predicted nucleic acid-binding protein